MKGRAEFDRSEVEAIRKLLSEKVKADRSRQKRIRDKLRGLGFYISDFSDSYDGFTEHDFTRLVDQGRIRVVNEPSVDSKTHRQTNEQLVSTQPETSPTYAVAAAKYRPDKIRLLILAEAPPSEASRYFYFEGVSHHDSLWVETMRMLYQNEFGVTSMERRRKPDWLSRFRDDGCFLIDAVKAPVIGDKHSIKRAISARLDAVITEIHELRPDGVLVVKKVVWDALGVGLRSAGIPILNDGPVMFPGTGQQGRFHAEVERLRIRQFVREHESTL